MNAEAAPPQGWPLERRLRRRLLALLVLAWGLGAAAALLNVREETDEVLDGALQETGQHLLDLPDAAFEAPLRAAVPAGAAPHEEYLVYQVFDAAARLRLRSHQAPLAPLAPPAAAPGFTDAGDWRVAVLQGQGRRVLVAERRAHRAEVVWEASLWLLLPLLLMLPIGGLGLHWVLRSVFGTLTPLQQALQRSADDARPDLPLQGMPAELLPLLRAVNEMRARLRQQLQAERDFAARMAHELRTPLAAARANAQRLLGESPPGRPTERAQALLRQIDRVTALASRLLQLARIEAGTALRRESVDLNELARLVLAEFNQPGQPGRLSLQPCARDCRVQADLDALGIALRNLLDNALRHAGPVAPVELRVEPRGLIVRDRGPGLDAARLQALVAGESSPSGAAWPRGAGLGLPLVRRIAAQSGARLELRSPLPEGPGLEAALRFD